MSYLWVSGLPNASYECASLIHFPFSCRATEWPFWFGHILPFGLIYIFNWAVFIVILANLFARKFPSQDKKQQKKRLKQNIAVAIGLSILFGLGWGFGLTATSSSTKEVTFVFQVIFSVFVGAQGILIFILHGLRSKEARKIWRNLCVCLSFKKKEKYPFLSSNTKGKANNSVLQMSTVSENPYSSTWQSESTVPSTHATAEIGSSEKSAIITGAPEQGRDEETTEHTIDLMIKEK